MKAQLAKAQALLNLKKPKTDEAMKLLQPLVNKKNAPWPAFHFSGIAMVQKGDYAMALSFLQEAVKQGSDEPETYHAISICYFNMADYDQAELYANKALKKNPKFFKGWLHLGSLYRAQARLDEALSCFQKANQIDPTSAGVAYRIGEIYADQGVLDKAVELFNITLKIDKEYLTAYLAKADILIKQSKYDEAEDTIYEVLSINPSNVPAKVSLAELFKYKGNYDKAIELYEQLMERFPKLAGVRINYALCMQELGNFEESESNYLKAFEDAPSEFEALSNYLMSVHYNPERTKQEIYDAHMLWDQNFAPEERPARPVPYDKREGKKLRVGFLSGGFRTHPVGWMIISALENLPRDQFEVYCYTTHNRFDRITKRIHEASDRWQSVIGYSDEVIACMIRDDEIDILVELSGHAADTRLKTVVKEPAPVMVKWVGGLFNTTGLESVDYLITDHQETPEGEEEFYTEKLVRMPDDYICFLPPEYAPDVAGLPAKEKGHITFGCFNNPTKVNDVILEKWATIMKQVPNSKLFLKSKQYDTTALRERIIETMERFEISEDRLIFDGQSKHHELLNCYNQVDIALDPWPYSGGLTTCEALWMGTPVITTPGPTFAGRHSTTHLHNVGLPEWIAEDWDEYIGKAVELASDKEKLAEIRAGLREKIAQSPVCDGKRFGAHLSEAFRSMWKQRVKGYENNLPEGEWQDHIEVPALSDEEISKITIQKDVFEQVDEVESDFIQQGIAEALGGDPVYSNGSSENGSVNGTAGQKPKETACYKIGTKDGVTICTPKDRQMMTPYVLLEQNQWYENELNFIRDYLKAGMNFVDVGAGFGAYALPAAKLVGDEGKVFSFEPGSTAKKHLELSKQENGFENLEIVGKAISSEAGNSAWKTAETPELNRLDDDGKEEVATTTLDNWWQFEGEPTIDFLKIDVNGLEAGVIEGASSLLEQQAPVLLVSIAEGNAKSISEALTSKGYKLYEYIPGAGVLADHEPDAGFDPYMQNLIAIKEEKVNDFKLEGWLYDGSVTPFDVESTLWKTELSKLPWTEALMEQWSNHNNSPEVAHYLTALNYLLEAEKIDATNSDLSQPRSQKASFQLNAAQILINLYNQGANSTSVVFTLVRVLSALGKRGQAVEVMQKLIQNTKLGQENMNVDLPFLLPVPEQDETSVKTELSKWLMVRTVEAWILIKDLTTYVSGPQEQKLLEVLEGNPEVLSRLNDFKTKDPNQPVVAHVNGSTNGVKVTKKPQANVVHVCFNHVYAQSLSDLIEHANRHSHQKHGLFIEGHRAIADYSVAIDNNPASIIFNFKKDMQSILDVCLKDEVDMVMFHGIFFDWQKKLIKAIGDSKHIGWVIWGGDLYNPVKNNELESLPAKLINSIHTSVKGDRELFSKYYHKVEGFDFAYPYPGLYGKVGEDLPTQSEKRIVVGNSGDASNNHIQILKELSKKKDIGDYQIVLPVAYNFSPEYKSLIEEHISKYGLKGQVQFYEKFISPDEYLNFIASSEIFIAAHDRQQAMGNILMSLYLGKKTILKEKISIHGKEETNPGWLYLTEPGLEPTTFEAFTKTQSLKEMSHSNMDSIGKTREIIEKSFGLNTRMEELLKACEVIAK
ncbi:TDP-N-acetylfucosamine:lipid II N-acetylfucosaminyltransferase [Gracilimonas mengyeensis]|uniref:protein O-GlcNAc transferase n=1 Tax=Gracilimonas mengyeensis TaxID=1302730 RepID=A0A521FI67_9BACT|nr:TDP-N-acetylfucosamine:lipid II N-acetylfucosaminyltransferase [Gracilimonas mengyeensis]SMO95907.1 methyltransferase, FkbM family [Gracilimonas mengyeensis]